MQMMFKVDAGSGKVLFVLIALPLNSVFSFSVQISGIGGISQLDWKPGSLDLVGRQRSSSDPPNMHPPVPPMRLTSTGGMVQQQQFSFYIQRYKTDEVVLLCCRTWPSSGDEDGSYEPPVQGEPGTTGIPNGATQISCRVSKSNHI